MEALRQRLAGSTTAPKTGSSKGVRGNAKKKATTMNLDHDDKDDELETEEQRQSQKELDEFKKLETKLKTCYTCGDKVYCKINKHRAHVHLAPFQLSAWANALVNFPLFGPF